MDYPSKAFDTQAYPKPQEWLNGMRKREYMASQALQGILAHEGSGDTKAQVKQALELADALIMALNDPMG